MLIQREAGDLLEALIQIDAVMMCVPDKLLYGDALRYRKKFRHKGGHDARVHTGRRGHILVEHDKDQLKKRGGECCFPIFRKKGRTADHGQDR